MTSGISNYVEHLVERKNKGKYKGIRILFYLGCVILTILIWLLCVMTKVLLYVAPFVSLVCGGIGFFLVRKYSEVEFEYQVAAGTMRFDKIYNRQKRKFICEFKLSDASKIAPYHDERYKKEADGEFSEIYTCVSDMEDPDVYYAIYTKEGKNCIVFFIAIQKFLSVSRFYNPSSTVMKKNLIH